MKFPDGCDETRFAQNGIGQSADFSEFLLSSFKEGWILSVPRDVRGIHFMEMETPVNGRGDGSGSAGDAFKKFKAIVPVSHSVTPRKRSLSVAIFFPFPEMAAETSRPSFAGRQSA